MASLIPSAPIANVPKGSLEDPDILLSSDTRSDSSLRVQVRALDREIQKEKEPLTEARRKRATSGQQQGSCFSQFSAAPPHLQAATLMVVG
jgi:hypothetical protein